MPMKKIRYCTAALAALLLLAPIQTQASAPYYSYNETSWSTEAAAPDSYLPEEQYTGIMLGSGPLSAPEDFCFDDQGNVYIADTGNNRIVIADAQFRFVGEIREVQTENGAEPLKEPQGVFAHKGFLYVADTENSRALKITTDGRVLAQYTRPDTPEYTAEMYRPVKIAVDKDDSVFILSEGVFQGLLLYENSGEFRSFFGSAPVQPSFKLLMDRLWKRILSKEQRAAMSNYVPVEYANLNVDAQGFVYACCLYTDNNTEQIRKLNYLGNNIYPYTGNFGEETVVYYKRNTIRTTFADVKPEADGILFGLDNTRGRVYGYDREGNRLFVFGGLGEAKGTFENAAALDSFGERVYVLDKSAGTLTSFLPTDYGKNIRQAVGFYNRGEYGEAQDLWEAILAQNCNLELAYDGMGEAYLKSGDYRQAVEYFRLANNQERESAAFQKYRGQVLRENIVWVALAVILLLAAVLLLTRRSFWQKRRSRRSAGKKPAGPVRRTLQNMGLVLIHPLTTLEELKYQRYTNWGMAGILTAVLFVERVASRQLTGFRFNEYQADTLNIAVELLLTVAPCVLFCLANWACCSILSGEGRFGEIVTFSSFALIPYLLFQIAGIALSNVLTLAEGDFLNWFLLIGTLWSVFLLFQAVRIVHQYTVGKTILLILLSLAGILIILFICLLLFSLFQQMRSFVVTLFSELSYK